MTNVATKPADLHKAFTYMASGQLGGFATRLGDLWFAADSANRAKIEQCFPEIIDRAWQAHLSHMAGERRLRNLSRWMDGES